MAVHLHQYYRNRFGLKPEDFPNATRISETTVSIPLSPHLGDAEVDRVIEAIRATIPATGS